MQSESQEPFLNRNSKVILIFFITFTVIALILFRNLFFQSNYILKSFGELSVNPELALKNNKPTFLEFYAEWCEVCKEMAPQVSSLKEEYDKDINFVFLNVDNQKWDSYIRKFNVNGIPQINLFDNGGNLISTFVGKQEEAKMREYIGNLKREVHSNEEILNSEFTSIEEFKQKPISPRSHG